MAHVVGGAVRIGERRIGPGEPPYLVAEMACAHEGDPDKAAALTDAAADAGADAIQLQVFHPDELLTPDHPGSDAARTRQLTTDTWRSVIRRARTRGLHVFVNVFGPSGLAIARSEDVQAVKLHSTDVCNHELIVDAARLGHPVSLAVGGCTLDEIVSAVSRVRGVGASRIVLMAGIQRFPTAVEDCHLRLVPILQALTGCVVGYQDHVAGDSPLALTIPLVAAGIGAAVIEKHIVIDRSRRGTDHESALEPQELRRFVTMLRQVAIALGSAAAAPLSPAEAEYRRAMKKVVVAARELRPGDRVTRDAVRLARAGAGASGTELVRVLDRVVARRIPQYAVLSPGDLEDA